MKTFKELGHMTVEQLYSRRDELFSLYDSEEVTKSVREAAAVLHNFYGAEIDARMMGAGK